MLIVMCQELENALSKLPDEILIRVFSYLEPEEILRLRLVFTVLWLKALLLASPPPPSPLKC
jgi:hypothetical protein